MPVYEYAIRIPVGLETSRLRPDSNAVLAEVRRMVDGALGQIARLGGGGAGGGGGVGGGRGVGGGFGGRDANDHVRVFREQQKEVERINAQTARQAEAQARVLNRTLTQLEKQTADARIREQKRAADNFLRTMKEMERGAQASAKNTSLTFSQLFGANFLGNLASRAVSQAVTTVVDTVGESFNRAASFEGLTRGLTAVTGSAEETERQLVRLKEASKQPGLTFREAIEGSRNLQATGMNAAFAERNVKAYGNALAIVGRNDRENLRGVFLAVQQIANTPFLQGDELRQLQERLPQVSKLLRDAFGTARSEELKEMGVSSQAVLEAIVSGLEKLPVASGGALVAMEDLQDAWDQALVAFGSGFLQPVAAELVDVSAALERNQGAFKEWGQTTGDAIRGLRAIAESDLGWLIGEVVRVTSPLLHAARALAGIGRWARGAPAPKPLTTDVVDFGNSVAVDNNTLRPRATVSKEDRKLLEKQRDLVEDLRREIDFFGDKSAVAATKQKLLAAGVTNLNSGLAAQALQLAATVDRLRDAADVAELVEKKLKETEDFSKDVGEKLRAAAAEARRQALDDMNEVLGFKPGAEFKFEHSQLGMMAKAMPGVKKDFDDATAAMREADAAAATVEPFRKRKAAVEGLTSSMRSLVESLYDAANPPETKFEEFIRSLERSEDLPERFGNRIREAKRELEQWQANPLLTAPANMQRLADFQHIFAGLLTDVNDGKNGIKLTADEVQKLSLRFAQGANSALQFDRSNNLLADTLKSLDKELKEAREEVGVAAETAAKRYELAWQQAFNAVALADDAAALSMIESQARLADQTVYHSAQANAAVMEFLASQRSVTEVIADAKVGVIQGTFDLIDRGLGRATSKLGIMGDLVRDLLSGFIRIALTPFFQSTFAGGSGGGQAAGGGFGFGSLLGGLLGGGGGGGQAGYLTGGFAGGPSPAAGLPGGLGIGGGGITAPQAFTGSLSSLSPDLRRQLSLAALDSPTGNPFGGAAAGGLFGQARGALGGMAPLLGLGLGASLGGGSRVGSILGGAGGLLGGLLGSAVLGGGGLGGILGGSMLGNLGGFLGVGAGALGAATFGIATAALLIGGLVAGRNAARRRDETKRNTISNDTGTAIWDLIERARSLSLSQARQEWGQIEANYRQQIAQIKDGKTRRNAEKQWREDFAPLWNIVEQRAREGEKSREFKSDFSPTFWQGGDVAVRFSDGGMMRPFTGRVPGVYDRRDDRVIRVSGDETVLTPLQRSRLGGHAAMARAGVPGYADGVTLGRQAAGVLPPMQITIRVELGQGDRTRIVMEELRSQAGREAVAEAVSEHIDREGMEGLLGAITLNLQRRGYVG